MTQLLYLPEHHLKYKWHGLIQDNCFLSDDDEVLALPLSANLDEEVQEDETDMFKKLIAEGEKSSSSAQKLKSPPAKKLKSPAKKVKSPPAKKVKEHVSCSHIDVDVGVSDSVLANGIKPDVVIEVEESEAAKERGHVIIAIENPNPELEVQIVVRKKEWPGVSVRLQFLTCFHFVLWTEMGGGGCKANPEAKAWAKITSDMV